MTIYLYKITNLINGKYYIGIHRGAIDDDYMGSGKAIKEAIKKYGRSNFKKDILQEFDSIEKAWDEEQQTVTEQLVNDPNCYNLRLGGRGGWEHIDSKGDKNPMRNPDTARKVGLLVSKKRSGNEYYAEISRENAKKGAAKTRGKKRPNQSIVMKKLNEVLWNDDLHRAKIREIKSDRFTVVSPCGIIYDDVYLTEICERFNLPFTTMWVSAKYNGKVVTKGKAKFWSCRYKKIQS
jgi:hypothetical protein